MSIEVSVTGFEVRAAGDWEVERLGKKEELSRGPNVENMAGLLLEKVLCVSQDNLKLTILPPFYLQSAVIISAKTHLLK